MTTREQPQERTPNQGNRIVEFLFGVYPPRKDGSEYRKARFLVTAALILSTGIGILLILLLQIAPQEILAYMPVLIGSIAINALAYLLGRSRFHKVGAWLLLAGLSATGFLLIPIRSEDMVDQISSTLPLAFVIGSLLFTIPEYFIFAGLNVLAIILIPTLVPEINISMTVSQAIIYVLLGSIILIITSIRNSSEREQLALAEQANKELVDIQRQLEDRITERTEDLVRRTLQLRASVDVARQAATIHNLNDLLSQVTHLIADRFSLYHVGIFLTTENAEDLILQAASSVGGKKMLEDGYRLPVGKQSLVGSVIYERQAFIALDVGKSAEFFNEPNLPETRSEVALPLIARDEIIGVLDLQSSKPEAFSEEDIDTFQVMADQIAMAIVNTRLLAESEAIIAQLQAISSDSAYSAWKIKTSDEKLSYVYTPLGVSGLSKEGKEADSTELIKIPVQLRGQKIGTIKLRRRENEAWSEREENLVNELATQIGLAIENARLLETTQQRAEREQVIGEISSRATQTLDIDTMLQQVVRELGLAVDAANTFVQIGLPESDEGTPE